MAEKEDETKLDWHAAGVPVSRRFADPYYSLEDGLGETAHVFLDGNRLGARWPGAARFRVAELGFGTGLNFVAAWRLWRARAAPGAVLDYTGFERWPLGRDAMARALAHWPALAPEAQALLAQCSAAGPAAPVLDLDLGDARLTLVLGDARETLPRWSGRADAWFLDGFAPARNPEMWEPALLTSVYAGTVPGGTFATYTAAGAVRRALSAAGFAVEKIPGFARKREMLRGRRPRPIPEPDHEVREEDRR